MSGKIKNPKVLALLDKVHAYVLTQEYYLELYEGNLPDFADVDLNAILEKERVAAETLREIGALRGEIDSHYDEIALDVLEFSARFNFMASTPVASRFFHLCFEITPYRGILGVLTILGNIPLETREKAERYLKALEQYQAQVVQLRERTEQQAAAGVYMPKTELQLTLGALKGLYFPVESHPFTLTGERLKRVEGDHRPLIEASKKLVAGAMAQLKALTDYLESPAYTGKAPEAIGLWQYPRGKECYRWLVENNTAIGVTPEELHQTGLEEIEKIEAKMAAIRRDLGYDCDRQAFKTVMADMPELYEESREAIGRRYNRSLDKIRPRMKEYFDYTCKADCEAAALPEAQEAGLTFGHYKQPQPGQEKGIYYFNGSNPKTKTMLTAASTIYHELLPGHHYQINVTAENPDLHPFFKMLMPTAYTEGWAEYAAALAGEMGMYGSPMEEYGRLTLDMFLSARLVVDTGLNYYEWPAEKAAAFLKAHSDWDDTMVFSEINRYAVDIPGHALGYKYGSLMMQRLRDKAQQALGDRFDYKEYHTHVLELGSIPIKILEKHIDWYIAQKLNA